MILVFTANYDKYKLRPDKDVRLEIIIWNRSQLVSNTNVIKRLYYLML